MNWSWSYAAESCERIYGCYVNWEEKYFICPECGEPIYEEDYWTTCPVCEFNFEEGE